MRRIVVAVMSTLSALVLLFSYHTSTNSGAASAAATPDAGTESDAAGATSGTTASGSSSSDSSSSSSSGASSDGSSTTGASTTSGASGTYTGDAVSTRWGDVQVRVTVADGKVTASEAVVYPQGNSRDEEINAYALPVLGDEAVTAQSAQIDAVSGATVTSDGYISSLQSALDQAHL